MSRILLPCLWINEFHEKPLDTGDMAGRISSLMRDSEVERKLGIIPYILTGQERYLNQRAFPDDIKMAVWERLRHICPHCHREFDFKMMEGDHIKPWSRGGKTVEETARCCAVSATGARAAAEPWPPLTPKSPRKRPHKSVKIVL